LSVHVNVFHQVKGGSASPEDDGKGSSKGSNIGRQNCIC
jgi:hypothetical protein